MNNSNINKPSVDLLLICPLCVSHTLPLGVMSIGAYVRSKGYSVDIIVGDLRHIKNELTARDLGKTMLGFSATTDVIDLAVELCAWLKNTISADLFCVIGGFHATALPEQTLRTSDFDCLVEGEGELTVLEILENFLHGQKIENILGAWTKDENKNPISTSPRPLIEDLNILPKPAFDLVPFDSWKGLIRTHDVHCERVGYLLTSRGCPFDCVFCDSKSMWHRKLRAYSTEYCVDLIEHLIDQYQLDGISFLDDEVVAHKKRILALCAELQRRGLHKKFKWEAHASAARSDPDVFKAMKDAGCVLVRIGLESGSRRILTFLKKGAATVEKNHSAVNFARQAGLNVFGSFIIGSPDETIDDIVQTIHFIKNSKITDAAVFVAVPYPGTELYDLYKKADFFEPNLTFSDYVVDGTKVFPIFRNNSFTASQLDSIKRFINIHVTEPLNHRKKLKDLDYKLELEKIVAGDLRMTDYSISQKFVKHAKQFARRSIIGIKNPKKIIEFISRRLSDS